MRAHCIVAVVAAASGCGTPVVAFDVPITAETTVPGGGVLEQVLAVFGFEELANVDLADTREFDNNNVQREQVTSARLTSLNLTIVSPQGANFDWLDELTFIVAADDEDEADVASKSVDNGVAAFACDLADVELAPYVRASSFALTTEIDARRPPQDTTIRVDMNFAIAATVF
jgi:uncharacterized glyoxalase superfamily protein PhnB